MVSRKKRRKAKARAYKRMRKVTRPKGVKRRPVVRVRIKRKPKGYVRAGRRI